MANAAAAQCSAAPLAAPLVVSSAPSWSQIAKALVAGGVAGGLYVAARCDGCATACGGATAQRGLMPKLRHHLRRSRTAVAPLERLKILLQARTRRLTAITRRGPAFRHSRADMLPLSSPAQVQATTPGVAPKYTGVWQVRRAARARADAAIGAAVGSERCADWRPSLFRCFSPHPPLPHQGLVYMARNEGLRGMMKGNGACGRVTGTVPAFADALLASSGANCLRIVPNSAVKFLTYEQLSRIILEQRRASNADAEMTPLVRLGAGAVAGIVAMSATYPLDMVRGRLTVQADGSAARYSGLGHAIRTIVREEGALAFYKGWLPSVIGVVPYVGLNFAVYETLKDMAVKQAGLRDESELAVVTRLGCGAVAGSVGQTVAYPLDVVRRRLQVSGWSASKSGSAAGVGMEGTAYSGMVDCFVKTVRHEGPLALFKGLWPNYIKVVPSIAIAFVSYEQLKSALGVNMRISD